MASLEQNIQLSFPHRVFFTENVFSPENTILDGLLMEGEKKVFVFIDQGVVEASPLLLNEIKEKLGDALVAEPFIVEGGEGCKNTPQELLRLYVNIEKNHLSRHSYILAIGGGAVLDTIGFVAATAHRGIRLIRMPSTTLSQADSGVGVKNGINAFGKKNFIGTFSVPYAVVNDFTFLSSLTDKQKREGVIEAIKVALIKDKAFFEFMEAEKEALARLEEKVLHRVIERSAQIHLEHIATQGDPFEMGSSRPLDFGHWAAHKLEQISRFTITHGEAVSIGVAIDVLYSAHQGFLSWPEAKRILALLQKLRLSLFHPLLNQKKEGGGWEILDGLDEFREHLGGELTIMLLQEIGRGKEVHDMDGKGIEESIEYLQSMNQIDATDGGH